MTPKIFALLTAGALIIGIFIGWVLKSIHNAKLIKEMEEEIEEFSHDVRQQRINEIQANMIVASNHKQALTEFWTAEQEMQETDKRIPGAGC